MATDKWARLSVAFTLLAILLSCTVGTSQAATVARPSPRVVRTKYGQLRGKIVTPSARYGAHLPPVEVFMGVPYVSPPLGTLRFMPPVNSPHWDDVRVADVPGPACPQRLPDFLKNDSATAAAAAKMPSGRLDQLRRLAQASLGNTSEDCLHLNIYTPASGQSVRTLEVGPR
ncbi:carboxylesterase 1F [Ixodes scapularis]|uniref:carboxylesterase 1F n=1 Tax=Ixodes scapularis TaxID=6945 RepID=UPI001A9DB213|nr:carboxylesterase 1F [Ixodes scapularis]